MIALIDKAIAPFDNSRTMIKEMQVGNKPLSHGQVSVCLLEQSFYQELSGSTLGADNFLYISLKNERDILLKLLWGLDELLNHDFKVLCLPVGVVGKESLLRRPIQALAEKEVLVVAPSGNKRKMLTPGGFPEVLCVGASEAMGNRALFSAVEVNDQGECLKPEVLYQGVDVAIDQEGVEEEIKVSGTSVACAQVASLAASLFEVNQQVTAHDVKQAIYASCEPREGSKYGVVQPTKAIENIKIHLPDESAQKPNQRLIDKEIDYVVVSQCKRARRQGSVVQAIVGAVNNTSDLMKRITAEHSELKITCEPFKNFDLVHITAEPDFFDLLLDCEDLLICSAIDVNHFDQ